MDKQITLHVAVEQALKRELERRAKLEHLRISDVVRRAIYSYLKSSEKAA